MKICRQLYGGGDWHFRLHDLPQLGSVLRVLMTVLLMLLQFQSILTLMGEHVTFIFINQLLIY
ncbi:hypothetical protein XFFB_07420 [Xylella fastidiosa]|nr:hypothetical protein XFFB_07420 [Xylella fastidiosa]